jgi:hypothetical protein
VKEIGVPRDNHWPVASHWQTLSHNVVSSTSHCTGSYKSKYHMIRPQQPPDKILSYSRTNLFIGSILCYNLFRLYFYFSCIFIFPTLEIGVYGVSWKVFILVLNTVYNKHTNLIPLSSTLSPSSPVRSGIRDRWLICVEAQPNWKIMTKGA